jgi:TM2 domain-containing membrane protein YozV
MQPTRNKCRATYRLSDGALVCVDCGNQLPTPALVADGSGKRGEFVAAEPPVGEGERAMALTPPIPTLIAERPAGAPAEVSGLVQIDQPKSPSLAALLSFLMVGMGQVYLGQVEKGLCMLGVVLLLIMNATLGPLGVVILFLNVVDAYLLGRRVKAGQQVRRWQVFFQSK